MNELINISVTKIGAEEVQAVSARELYIGLGLNVTQWARWGKTNIEESDFFSENKDWVGLDIMSNGNETTDYAISIEFAKHLAMMARTGKAHEYRNYFIECERQAMQKIKPMSAMEMVIASAQAIMRIEQEQARLAEQALESAEAIKRVEARQSAIEDGFKFYTVLGYCNLHQLRVNVTEAKRIGKECAKLSRERDIAIDRVTDPRFGQVNAYHESVLSAVIGSDL